MTEMTIWLKRGVISLTSTLLVIVAVILFALLAIAMRPLLIVLAVAGLIVTWALYHASPAFREWFESAG
jgi:hypothetical protein